MSLSTEDIAKGVAALFGGGALWKLAEKVIDWARAAPKDRMDLTKTGVEMLLDIIEREKIYSKQVTESNDGLVKKNHDLRNENDELRVKCSEKDKLILDISNKLDRCQHDLKRAIPDDRNRGRRSNEGIP